VASTVNNSLVSRHHRCKKICSLDLLYNLESYFYKNSVLKNKYLFVNKIINLFEFPFIGELIA